MITTIVKVTKAQMDLLEAGGTIGTHTYDPEHCLYTVDDGLVLPDNNGTYGISTSDNGETYQYVDLRTITDRLYYNLGAYDSVVDNGDGTITITRQTGYADTFQELSEKLGIDIYGDGVPPWANGRLSINTTIFEQGNIVSIYPVMDGDSAWNYSGSANFVISYSGSRISIYSREDIGGPRIRYTKIELQWKLPTSYTETVIKGRPLSQLDAEGERYIGNLYRSQVNVATIDGLNKSYAGTGDLNSAGYGVYWVSPTEFKYYRNATSANSYMCIDLLGMDLKPSTTYTLAVYGSNFQDVQIYIDGVKTFTQTGNEYTQNSVQINYTFTTPGAVGYAYVRLLTPFNGTAIGGDSAPVACQVMLNKGNLALPYVSFAPLEKGERNFVKEGYRKTLNLCKYVVSRDTSTTPHNISVTETKDASGCQIFSLSATGTYSRHIFQIADDLEVGKTYTFACAATSANGAFTLLLNSLGTSIDDMNYGRYYYENGYRGATFTAVGPKLFVGIYLTTSASTFSATLSEFMLVKGPLIAPYALYDASGHITHPEAKLLLDEYKKTINLFNSSRVYNYAKYPVTTFTVGEGSVSITNRGQYPYNRVCFDIPNANNKTFTFSATVPYNTQVYIYQKDSSNTTLINQPRYVSGTALTFTPTADIVCICFYAYNPDDPWGDYSSAYKVITFSNIMINEGPRALPYQPYDASGHITHPEAKLLLDEYEKTINLLSQNEMSVTANNQAYANKDSAHAVLQIGKTYTISYTAQITNSSHCPYVAIYYNGTHIDKDGAYNTDAQTFSFTFTATNTDFYLKGYASTGTALTNTLTISNIMLVESPTALPYCPYYGPIVHEGSSRTLLWSHGVYNPKGSMEANTTLTFAKSVLDFKYLIIIYKNWCTSDTAVERRYRIYGIPNTNALIDITTFSNDPIIFRNLSFSTDGMSAVVSGPTRLSDGAVLPQVQYLYITEIWGTNI